MCQIRCRRSILENWRNLKFARPRYDDFPALNLARRAGETGGTFPAVLNAANEIAVSAFLEKRMSFPRIWQTVEQVMDAHESVAHPDLDAILRADQWARAEAGRHVEALRVEALTGRCRLITYHPITNHHP